MAALAKRGRETGAATSAARTRPPASANGTGRTRGRGIAARMRRRRSSGSRAWLSLPEPCLQQVTGRFRRRYGRYPGRVLIELDITNLALVDHARIAFGPGLNVLTGETGAGKSIVIDAVGLLVGGRADAGMIRAGAEAARVEGFFQAGAVELGPLEEAGIAAAGDEILILSRELAASGRNV